MTIVADNGASDARPCTGPADTCTLNDYASLRRLAVNLRGSAIAAIYTRKSSTIDKDAAKEWLEDWGDPDAGLAAALLLTKKADPDVDGIRFAKLPANAGVVFGAGAAEVFTSQVPELAKYVRRGDDIVPAGEGNRAVKAARSRTEGQDSRTGGSGQVGVALWSVAATVTGGLLVAGILAVIRAVKRGGR